MVLKHFYFNTDEAAMFINVSQASVLNWCNKNQLEHKIEMTKRGRVRYISAQAICDFLYLNPKYQKYFRQNEQPEELE